MAADDARVGGSNEVTTNPGSRGRKSLYDWLEALRSDRAPSNRPIVCVQGLGFVGAAMAVAVASAKDTHDQPWFDVVGVDLPTPIGRERAKALNDGRFPFPTVDQRLVAELKAAKQRGNLRATDCPDIYAEAAVTVVDVPLDVVQDGGAPKVRFESFRESIRTLGERMTPGSLVVVETTIPPGTCEKVVVPELERALENRFLAKDSILLAHSYERVMPGEGYLDSVTDIWRVYAGLTDRAADACELFLSKVINVQKFPLTRLQSTTASELVKVLENSYRAATIAFMEEWGRFAEAIGIDIFEVIEAIRKRPTHNNMRQPGFGVGGYCLTKDPLFAPFAAREYYGLEDASFSISELAVTINRVMPLVTLDKVQRLLGGSVAGRKLLLLGVSYRQDVGDTRNSPSETFVRAARARGAQVTCHDPLVEFWPEMNMNLQQNMPPAKGYDAVVFAVPHRLYRELDLAAWLDGANPLIFDANCILDRKQQRQARQLGCRVGSIGRGNDL